MKKLLTTFTLSLIILSTTVFPVSASNLTNQNITQSSVSSDSSKPSKITLNKKALTLILTQPKH